MWRCISCDFHFKKIHYVRASPERGFGRREEELQHSNGSHQVSWRGRAQCYDSVGSLIHNLRDIWIMAHAYTVSGRQISTHYKNTCCSKHINLAHYTAMKTRQHQWTNILTSCEEMAVTCLTASWHQPILVHSPSLPCDATWTPGTPWGGSHRCCCPPLRWVWPRCESAGDTRGVEHKP